jgi:hypothetical protein
LTPAPSEEDIMAQRGLLEPLVTDVTEWFAELDRDDHEPFMLEDRGQPATPIRPVFP